MVCQDHHFGDCDQESLLDNRNGCFSLEETFHLIHKFDFTGSLKPTRRDTYHSTIYKCDLQITNYITPPRRLKFNVISCSISVTKPRLKLSNQRSFHIHTYTYTHIHSHTKTHTYSLKTTDSSSPEIPMLKSWV